MMTFELTFCSIRHAELVSEMTRRLLVGADRSSGGDGRVAVESRSVAPIWIGVLRGHVNARRHSSRSRIARLVPRHRVPRYP